MITVEEIEDLLKERFPQDRVTVTDLTGTQDHFRVEVTSAQFQGQLRIQQHRLVQEALAAPLADGRIHALSIKTSDK
jgi:stress-induced morphogen